MNQVKRYSVIRASALTGRKGICKGVRFVEARLNGQLTKVEVAVELAEFHDTSSHIPADAVEAPLNGTWIAMTGKLMCKTGGRWITLIKPLAGETCYGCDTSRWTLPVGTRIRGVDAGSAERAGVWAIQRP